MSTSRTKGLFKTHSIYQVKKYNSDKFKTEETKVELL
jgi:hypothetical protein